MPKATRSKLVARQEQALELRRGIRAAQLRVALDKQRGRPTPAAVVRVANRKLPEVTLTPWLGGVKVSRLGTGARSRVTGGVESRVGAVVSQPKEQRTTAQ